MIGFALFRIDFNFFNFVLFHLISNFTFYQCLNNKSDKKSEHIRFNALYLFEQQRRCIMNRFELAKSFFKPWLIFVSL